MYPFDCGPNGLLGVAEPTFFTSKGVVIQVDPWVPYLHVGFNPRLPGPMDRDHHRSWGVGSDNTARALLPLPDPKHQGDGNLHLVALPYSKGKQLDGVGHHPLWNWKARVTPSGSGCGRVVALRYSIHVTSNAQQALATVLHDVPRPVGRPPDVVFERPIWTTWATFKADVTQDKVKALAMQIQRHGFPRSVMEIDDRWSVGYGDLEFDTGKFPDPAAMVDDLHRRGFLVTLWVIPFCSEHARAFKHGMDHGYWVKAPDGSVAMFKWWQPGMSAALDVTNPAAVNWFNQRLYALQRTYGIDGFKFDGGDACFLPDVSPGGCVTHKALRHPGEYTHLWVERVANAFPNAEVRVAYRSQSTPHFVREWDRFSIWGLDDGLHSIITAAFAIGCQGYPFVLPDMIGGNAYGNMPERELLIRWAQANALLPAMQFSIPPWESGHSQCDKDESSELCRRAAVWHKYFANYIISLAQTAIQTSYPIVRPLFMLAPTDASTLPINDQFALGDAIIAAPVLWPHARSRDIYLPSGTWVDILRAHPALHSAQYCALDMPLTSVVEDAPEVIGPCWLRNYAAPLDFLPCFVRLELLRDIPPPC